MNKILIVDDEKWVRAGVHTLIEKSSLFGVIDEAVSGKEAILKSNTQRYDIIITDIKMPDMTGLDLIKEIRKENNFTRFIIVSGYSDFEYARTAIALGVDNYLLKPVKAHELREAVEQSLTAVNESKLNEKLQDVNENLISGRRNKAFEKALNHIFYTSDEKEILSDDELIKYNFKNKKYVCLAVVFLNESEMKEQDFFEGGTDLLKYGIKNVLEETFCDLGIPPSEYFIFNNLHNFNQIFVLMTDYFPEKLEEKTGDVMRKLQKRVLDYLELEIRIGISGQRKCVEHELYLQCKHAYCLRFVQNGEYVYFYKPYPENNLNWQKGILVLKNNIVWRKSDGILNALKQIFCEEYYEENSIYCCVDVYWAILYMLISLSVEMQLPFDKQFAPLIKNSNSLDDFCSFSQLIKYIHVNIIEVLGINKEIDSATIIRWIKEYVDANYAKDIGVSDIAEKLDFHPAYFSVFFKKQMSKNFSKYLAEVRISKACELLLKSNYSNQEIAKMVGYNDSQYFYKVFKSVMGMTPFEYRMKKI